MAAFIHISPRIWRLSSDMTAMSSPGYERLLRRIAREMAVADHRRERMKRNRGYFRAHVKLECPAETISLFHSSRSGYRAQYYSSMRRGDLANRIALTILVPRIRELLNGQEKRTCPWPWMEKSLRDPAAKVWIHQGTWLRANARTDRNLFVQRWFNAQSDEDTERQKRARWAALTPTLETCIEVKGGFVSLSGTPLGTLKETRSRDLHELGFT
jgi:hypothetical protein